MIWRIVRTSLVTTALLLSATVSAALRYEVHIEVIREDETEHFAERVTTSGDNARVDFLDAGGNPDGSYIVTHDGGKTMAIHDGGRAICSEWDRAEFFEAAGRMLEKGARMVNVTISGVDTQLVSEEPGPVVEGYPTRHVVLKTNYSGSGRFLFIKINYAIEERDELWITDTLEVPDFEQGWMDAAARTGNEFIDEHERNWMEHTRGAILKHTNVIRLTNEKSGKTQEKTEHFTVTNIQQLDPEEIPAATFEMPACKKVKQSEMEHQAERMLKKYLK